MVLKLFVFLPNIYTVNSATFPPTRLFGPTRLLDSMKNFLPTRLIGTTRLLDFLKFSPYTFIWTTRLFGTPE